MPATPASPADAAGRGSRIIVRLLGRGVEEMRKLSRFVVNTCRSHRSMGLPLELALMVESPSPHQTSLDAIVASIGEPIAVHAPQGMRVLVLRNHEATRRWLPVPDLAHALAFPGRLGANSPRDMFALRCEELDGFSVLRDSTRFSAGELVPCDQASLLWCRGEGAPAVVRWCNPHMHHASRSRRK
jgi:hypothetical protein